MKIRVNPHTVEIVKEQTEPINEREINVSKCEFEFDEEITSEFVKEAYFTLNGNTYKQIIQNNECDYPSEVLAEKGTLEIGVVAFKVENGKEIVRYNPSPDYFESWVGSLKDAENSVPITPTDKEQMEQAIENINLQLDNVIKTWDIVDNLESDNPEKPLSAKQGKILDGKKPNIYDSVANMKADTSLKTGMTAQTLGYYEPNDGGGATYKITDEESETDYQEELENGLYASLIIEDNKINVKQFGAKGDGETDDTQAIQNCANYCEKYNNIFQDSKVLYFTTGEYLTSDTIHLSIACRIRFTGNVAIITSVIDKACIKIDTKDLATPSTGYLFQQMNAYEEGGLIDGDGIFAIQHTGSYFNDLTRNCIGLELGDTIDRQLTPSIAVARTYIKNIHISGFNTAIKMNKYHLYILTFDDIVLSKNTINVKYGDSDSLNTGTDLGEKITFNNSLFAVSYCGVEINTFGHFYFNNCSFDFNGCVFRLNSKQLSNINIVGGHIEGIGDVGRGIDVTTENTIGYGQVLCIPESTAGTGACYNVNFIGTAFHLSSSINLTYPLFKSATPWNQYSTDLNINIVNCGGFTYQTPTGLTNDVFMSDGNVKINKLDNATTSTRLMHNKNTDYSGLFLSLDNSLTGTNSDSDTNYTTLKGKGFRINGTNYVDSSPFDFSIDTTKKLFEKSIKIDISSFDYPSVDRIISCKKNNVMSCAWFKLDELNPRPDTNIIHHFDISSRYIFYTKDNQEILANSIASTTINVSDLENGYGRTKLSKIRIPLGAEYCVIKNTISAKQSDNSLTRIDGSLYWCGTLVNFED